MGVRGETDRSATEGEFERRAFRAQMWALALLAISLLVGSGWYAYRQGTVLSGDMLITAPAAAGSPRSAAQPEATPPQMIAVHVGGAVATPGVYELPAGSRVEDALKLAGGVSKDADPDSVNPAAALADADQVLVPRRSPDAPAGAASSAGGAAASPRALVPPAATDKLRHPGDGFVNINSASETELQRLPGVGPATAARIIEHRKQIRRFAAVEQLMDVSGIGEKKLAAMRPFVKLR